jgi:hypothetical protein
MADDPKNITLGACNIVWGNTILGATMGGMSVRVSAQTKPIEADQTGANLLNEYILGRSLILTVSLAETSVNNLYEIIASSGASQPGGDETPVYVQTFAGLSQMPDAMPMLLRPINMPDGSGDMYLPAVAFTGDLKFSYKSDQARVFALNFIGFADVNNKLFYLGSTPQGNTMAGYLTDSNHFNIIDDTVGDRGWFQLKDSTGGEVSYR